MTKKERSEYQKAVISDYYANLDTIMLGKLSNLVSELFLADSKSQRDKLWQKAHRAMEKLNVPEAIINHIMEKRDEEILAKNIQDWINKSGKK